MDWLALSIEVPRDQSDPAEQALQSSGALAVTLSDAGDSPVLETAPGETPLWPRVRLTGLYPQDADPEGVRLTLAAALGEQGVDVKRTRLADREWTRAWMDRFGPMRFGNRLWVLPTRAAEPASDGIFIRLDPGLAFGTGTHATTALCLEWLEANEVSGMRVVDYGCGSGILGIAAARLGAADVWCVDHDRQALAATLDNAAANNVSDRIKASTPDTLGDIQADVVVANILFQPLVELAPRFASILPPGGRVVMSGLLDEQAPALERACRTHFTAFQAASRDGWSRVVTCRPD